MTPILVLVQSNMTEHLLSVADVVLSIAVEGISTVDHCRHIPSIDRSKLSTKDERVSAQRGFEESTSFIMENELEIEEEIERSAPCDAPRGLPRAVRRGLEPRPSSRLPISKREVVELLL